MAATVVPSFSGLGSYYRLNDPLDLFAIPAVISGGPPGAAFLLSYTGMTTIGQISSLPGLLAFLNSSGGYSWAGGSVPWFKPNEVGSGTITVVATVRAPYVYETMTGPVIATATITRDVFISSSRVRVAGTWHDGFTRVKVAGTWRDASRIHRKDDGSWS